MQKTPFKPYHMNATPDDLAGNDGVGRYVLLPGSDGRAQEIAEHFNNRVMKAHPRGHNMYLGTITHERKKIDVATISSGMGCPSMEIILHELFHLGAKRFLRVGTAGSLQSGFVKIGDIVNVQASVRDERTTTHYAPLEFPAVASLEFISAILLTAERLGLSNVLHTGIVHCKDSLYAREFGAGPKAVENDANLKLLTDLGVLASEMETAALFVQSQLYNYQLIQQGMTPNNRVLAGAILGIIATPHQGFQDTPHVKNAVINSIQLAIETIKTLAMQERLV